MARSTSRLVASTIVRSTGSTDGVDQWSAGCTRSRPWAQLAHGELRSGSTTRSGRCPPASSCSPIRVPAGPSPTSRRVSASGPLMEGACSSPAPARVATSDSARSTGTPRRAATSRELPEPVATVHQLQQCVQRAVRISEDDGVGVVEPELEVVVVAAQQRQMGLEPEPVAEVRRAGSGGSARQPVCDRAGRRGALSTARVRRSAGTAAPGSHWDGPAVPRRVQIRSWTPGGGCVPGSTSAGRAGGPTIWAVRQRV